MDVEFMLSDSLEVSVLFKYSVYCPSTLVRQAVRPKLVIYKTIEDAAVAVDDMLNLAFQNSGCTSFLQHFYYYSQSLQ
jgi:regulator of nonsense transcripts 2